LLASDKVEHRIAKYKEPNTIAEEFILPVAVNVVNKCGNPADSPIIRIGEDSKIIRIDGSAGFPYLFYRSLGLNYSSKINVEQHISSLNPRFEKIAAMNIIVMPFVESAHFHLV